MKFQIQAVCGKITLVGSVLANIYHPCTNNPIHFTMFTLKLLDSVLVFHWSRVQKTQILYSNFCNENIK